jgi:hypothetical protein
MEKYFESPVDGLLTKRYHREMEKATVLIRVYPATKDKIEKALEKLKWLEPRAVIADVVALAMKGTKK